MYRVVNMSGKYYGLKIFSVSEDSDDINQFLCEGTPVILCDSLDDLETLDILVEDIEIVKNDKNNVEN